MASLGVSRVEWDTLQVITVPGGFLSGCSVRWEEREYVPSLCCRWLEREDSFDKETGSSSEGAWENHSTYRSTGLSGHKPRALSKSSKYGFVLILKASWPAHPEDSSDDNGSSVSGVSCPEMSVSPQTVWHEEVLGKEMGWNIWQISFKWNLRIYGCEQFMGFFNFEQLLYVPCVDFY